MAPSFPESLISSLSNTVGTENTLTDPYDLDRYSGDALSLPVPSVPKILSSV
ncbi:MAG: hypothetical protein Ct9H300mP11_12660 [Chloroflexota bacterium]|nr:MAG: hypothetical protein Ct9H300mP11_12660 [Chloroflexota bacterium]